MRRRAFVLVNRAGNAVVSRVKPRRFRGGDLLILTAIGRKTGKQRTTQVLHLADQRKVSRRIAVAALRPQR